MNRYLERVTAALRDDEDKVAAYEILRPIVFDYVLRMTGRRDRALQIVEELEQALPGMRTDSDAFVVDVLKTARNFAADAWDANTDELMNLAYESDAAELETAEATYRMLPGPVREYLALRMIYGLLEEDTEAIMSVDRFDLIQSQSDQVDVRLLRGFKLHPQRIDSQHPSTVALSQIIGDIEESSGSALKKRMLIWMCLGLLAVAIAYQMLSKS